MKKITRKQAEKIANKSGYPLAENDGITFYATNDSETEVYEFDSKKEREECCKGVK